MLGKKITIFDYLNQIYYKTNKLEYDKKVASSYMLSMWLSHDETLVDIVNEINSLQFFLKDDIIYDYYMYKIPKGKRWIKWTKKLTVSKDEDIKLFITEKHLSKREATLVSKHKENIK